VTIFSKKRQGPVDWPPGGRGDRGSTFFLQGVIKDRGEVNKEEGDEADKSKSMFGLSQP